MPFHIGQRLSFKGNLCTVRFIGSVVDTSGEWLGVEWDDPAKGKHSGVYNQEKYFECRSTHPTIASFVRPWRHWDEKVSFLEALRGKYAADESGAGVNKIPTYFNNKLAEEVGFEKVSRRFAAFQELKVVVLNNMNLAGVGSESWQRKRSLDEWTNSIEAIRNTCPNIRHLDLSHNSIESFLDIVGICLGLPMLTSLNISRTRLFDLSFPKKLGVDPTTAFTNVVDLSLDSTLLSSPEIASLALHFPRLRSLSLQANELDNFQTALPKTLSRLLLALNPIRSLENIVTLSTLPTLDVLSLRGCLFKTLIIPGGITFPQVSFLDISDNEVSTNELGALCRHFPSVRSLCCSLSDETQSLLLIAQIAQLEELNYSSINASRRLNAELYYLSIIAKEIDSAGPFQCQAILRKHTRYHDLCRAHGKLDIIYRQPTPQISSRCLNLDIIKITCHDARPRRQGMGPISSNLKFGLQIPRSGSVYRLYARVARYLSTIPLHLRIIWKTDDFELIRQHYPPGKTTLIRSTFETHDHSTTPLTKASTRVDIWTGSGDDEGVNDANEERNPHWIQREVELVPGPRPLGFWIDGTAACIRIEASRET